MSKTEFLEKLALELKHKNVSDVSDIIDEYEQHFAFKLADGYSEEEIAAKLGDPKAIAAQYNTISTECKYSKKAITVVGLGVTDLFFSILCVLLYAWEIIIGALVVVFGTATIGLLANIRASIFTFISTMPYHCALVLGIAFAALTVLSVVGIIYFFNFIRQLMRSFGRFHKNTLAAASGKATLPSVTVYPQFSAKTKRILRKLSVFASTIFAICFVVGFAVCAVSAGSIEFWHIWGWFGYAV